MIVTRTPLRISFAGGGSDYEPFFLQEPGCIVGTTINQYIYVSLMPLPVFAEEKHRFTYRITESVKSVNEFKHPVVRTLLEQYSNLSQSNISTMANLPGRSGLGSSSSFTVGLINAIEHHLGNKLSKTELAERAIHVERHLLREPGGVQDQYHASFGGLRAYEFSKEKGATRNSLIEDHELQEEISKRLVLVPMSELRDSSIYAQKTLDGIKEDSKYLQISAMATLARELKECLLSTSLSKQQKLESLIEAVNEGWRVKSNITGEYAADSPVAKLIEFCKSKGAAAARLCGAGGSGFVLLISEEGNRDVLLDQLKALNAFPIQIAPHGSEVILNENVRYSNLGVVQCH
jgi:D-glycero-alpha-D-manno-heptose-7-phosphate kinase